MPTTAEYASLTFRELWCQTTRDEAVEILLTLGFLTDDPGEEVIAAHLMGPAVLDAAFYNNNEFTTLDGESYTSLLVSPNDLTTQLEAWQVFESLQSMFNHNKQRFCTTHYTMLRLDEMVDGVCNAISRTVGDDEKTWKAACWAATGETTPDLPVMPNPFWSPTEYTVSNSGHTPTTTAIKIAEGTGGNNAYNGRIVYFHRIADTDHYMQMSQVTGYDSATQVATISPALPSATGLAGCKFVLSSFPQNMKTGLDAMPAGLKAVNVSGAPLYLPTRNDVGFYYAVTDYELTTNGVDFSVSANTGGAPYITLWTPIVVKWAQLFFGYYKNTLGGAPINWVHFDVEYTPEIWEAGYTEAAINADAEKKAALEALLGWDLDDYDAVKAGWLTTHKQQAFRYAQVQEMLRAERINQIYTAIVELWPEDDRPNFTDYESNEIAPANYPAGYSMTRHPPLGPIPAVGTHNTANLYGNCVIPWRQKQEDFWRPEGSDWQMANVTTRSLTDSLGKWSSLIFEMMQVRSMVAASSRPRAAWVTYKAYNSVQQAPSFSSHYDSDLYYDHKFHIALAGCEFLYWTTASYLGETSDDIEFQHVLEELTEVMGYDRVITRSYDLITWDDKYVMTKADVGGRLVYRITIHPDYLSTARYTQNDDGCVITIDGTDIEIPYGTLITGGLSDHGVWVETGTLNPGDSPVDIRTTAEDVIALIPAGDYDSDVPVDAFMMTAHQIVESAGCAEEEIGYSDDQLELLERWLAAHFYMVRSGQVSSEGISVARKEYQLETGMYLSATTYGQQAMMLDNKGCLAALQNNIENGGTFRVGAVFLGKNRTCQ